MNTRIKLTCREYSLTHSHRLKMELDLHKLFGLHVHCTHLAETPHPPPPPHLGSYARSLLVSQNRRHLFVTPCQYKRVCISCEVESYRHREVVKKDTRSIRIWLCLCVTWWKLGWDPTGMVSNCVCVRFKLSFRPCKRERERESEWDR